MSTLLVQFCIHHHHHHHHHHMIMLQMEIQCQLFASVTSSTVEIMSCKWSPIPHFFASLVPMELPNYASWVSWILVGCCINCTPVEVCMFIWSTSTYFVRSRRNNHCFHMLWSHTMRITDRLLFHSEIMHVMARMAYLSIAYNIVSSSLPQMTSHAFMNMIIIIAACYSP